VRDPFLLDTPRAGKLGAARLQAVLDAATDAFFDVDLAARTIRWSRAVTLLFGHDPGRMGQRLPGWQGLIHPEDAPDVIESGQAVLPSGGSVWSHEFRLARADGTYAPVRVRAFLVLDAGRPSHVVGAVTDLSELRDRERELRSISDDLADRIARERLERARADLLMRAAASDAFVEWDLSTDELTWSPNVEMVLGWPSPELSDVEAALRHAHPEDGPRALADLRRQIAEGIYVWSGRVRVIAPDGEARLFDARGHLLRDETGRPLKVIGSMALLPEQRKVARGPDAPILTERQRQVLDLVRTGQTNKEIAGLLGISEQAAKVQVSKLLRKFHVQNRAALAAIAAGDLSG